MNIRLRQREEVKTLFSDIRHNPKKYLFIHYSSESFENNQGVPRILTVKISNSEGNDIKTFSVLHEAIIRKIGEDKIAENIDVEPSNCIVIEDSSSGIKAAYNASMVSFHVEDLKEADEEIKKYSDKQLKNIREIMNYL